MQLHSFCAKCVCACACVCARVCGCLGVHVCTQVCGVGWGEGSLSVYTAKTISNQSDVQLFIVFD